MNFGSGSNNGGQGERRAAFVPFLIVIGLLVTLPVPGWAADSASTVDLVKEAEGLQPGNTKPFAIAPDDKAARDHWGQVIKAYVELPAEQVTAHPAAVDFPGAVAADAPKVTRKFEFPLRLPRWQSTGLYAPPGAKIVVTVAAADVARGLSIVIGSHTDSLMGLAKWPRFPKISRKFPIKAAQTTVANAFGGLIYVDVPRDPALGGHSFATYGGYGWLDEHPEKVTGSVHVTITGAVEAPFYQLGKTTPEQWKRLRETPGPWGELASDKVILTVPSYMLKGHDDPAPLLEFWGKVVDAEASLAGWPRQPAPPERIVADREISAGFMHSGYPIMCHLGSGPGLLNVEKLKSKGDWGFFHELGHNHEGQAYTFGGDYVEVCVNLFSMYIMQKTVGREMTAHPALKDLDKVLQEKLGPKHEDGPWNNLAMYILPINALGWEPLQKTLATYASPDGAAGIKTREQKMDQFVLRYSKAAGKNLGPYFEAFGITCSPETTAAIKNLPTWMPEKFPGKYSAAVDDGAAPKK